MRRTLAVPLILAASVLLTPYALFAQRGGHAGGVSGGSFSGGSFSGARGFSGGGFSRGFPAPSANFSSGQRSFSSRSFSYPRSYSRSGFSSFRPSYGRQSSQSSQASWNRGRGRNPGRWRRNAYGWSYANGAFPYYANGGVVYWPYFGDSDDSTYAGNDYADQQPAQQADAEETDEGPRPSYEAQQEQAPGPYAARPAYIIEAPASSQPSVTIIYKDGRSQQIHNYALTRTSLLLLDDASSGRELDVPLDQIDLAATERTNRQAGVNFSLPISQ
jgi:hypothetical protein